MKRCLLICEGPFDELVFSTLKDIFDDSLLEIKPLCRCCADTPNLKDNVDKLAYEILSREHGYALEDFDEICFLIDADGVYTPNESIFENNELSSTNYKTSSIECPDKKSLIARNMRRSKNVSELLDGRKYWIFYNSRNLEHAFNESCGGHLSDKFKKRFALEIFQYYASNKRDFIEKLYSMNKSNTTNIRESWNYLQLKCNSLASSSNMFVFIAMHYSALKEEYKNIVLECIKKYRL